jgi:NADP-reducing hydrogenase subunit HndB
MPNVKSLDDLKRLKLQALEKRQAMTTSGRAQVVVAMGTCGIAAGARDTMKAVLDQIEADNLTGIVVTQTGCIGKCEWEPIVEVTVGTEPKVIYGKVSPERARKILKEHVEGGKVVAELVLPA